MNRNTLAIHNTLAISKILLSTFCATSKELCIGKTQPLVNHNTLAISKILLITFCAKNSVVAKRGNYPSDCVVVPPRKTKAHGRSGGEATVGNSFNLGGASILSLWSFCHTDIWSNKIVTDETSPIITLFHFFEKDSL